MFEVNACQTIQTFWITPQQVNYIRTINYALIQNELQMISCADICVYKMFETVWIYRRLVGSVDVRTLRL
jgi:hypothetical protein